MRPVQPMGEKLSCAQPLLQCSITPLLHYSNTPLLHYSTTPSLHYSTTPFFRLMPDPNEPSAPDELPVGNTPLFAANEKIDKINVAEEIKNSFLDYSMSVIISRALPDVRDGLKPSQRRILYAMNDLGVMPNRKHIKCAKIVRETMGNYHPHGDQAIYPTLVHMAQPWAMRERLVDGQGNFGSVEGDPPASMRYTEARLAPLGAVIMEDME